MRQSYKVNLRFEVVDVHIYSSSSSEQHQCLDLMLGKLFAATLNLKRCRMLKEASQVPGCTGVPRIRRRILPWVTVLYEPSYTKQAYITSLFFISKLTCFIQRL